MDFELKSDREIMIHLSGNITLANKRMDSLSETVEKFVKAIERLEEIKIKDIDVRTTKIEHKLSEMAGVVKFLAFAATLLGMLSILIAFWK